MKNISVFVSKLFLFGLALALAQGAAQAQTAIYWKGGASGSMNTNTNWATLAGGGGGSPSATNFPQGSSNNNPNPVSYIATFSATSQSGSTNLAITLPDSTITTWTHGTVGTNSYSQEWGSIEVLGSQTGSVTITSANGGTGSALVLGSTGTGSTRNMITVNAGAGAVTIGSATAANAVEIDNFSTTPDAINTYTITNNSSNALTLQNNVVMHSANQTATILVNGSGSTVFNGSIMDGNTGAGRLAALTVGTGAGSTSSATLNAATTFTGGTSVNGGTLTATATGSLADTGSITVSNGGTLNINHAGVTGTAVTVTSGGSLVFGSNNTAVVQGLTSGTNVSLNAGSLVLNGSTQTIGTLTLTGAVTIDLSKGGLLTINNIVWTTGATLNIIGWSGSSLTSGGDSTHQIILKSGTGNAWADMSTHLGAVTWTDATVGSSTGTVDGAGRTGSQGAGGQLVPDSIPIAPAPEPSTIFIGLGLVALLAWGGRNKIVEAGRSLASVRS